MVSPGNDHSNSKIGEALRPLVERLRMRGHVILTDYRRPAARVTPVDEKVTRIERARAIRLGEFGARHSLADLDWLELRVEGRQ